MKRNRSLTQTASMLLLAACMAVVVIVAGTSPSTATVVTMTKDVCQRCHGTDDVIITSWHHQIRAAYSWTCTKCHKTVTDPYGGYTLEVQRDCTVCHTPTYHSNPDGTLGNRHHAILNTQDYGCLHCHPMVQDQSGTWEVAKTSDCFFCHTDGLRPWREDKWLTNLPTTTAPDSAATVTDITGKFRDGLMYDYNEISNTTTVDAALSVRLDKDAGTTSKVTIGFYVFELPNARGTLRIYPYLKDGETVDTSAYVDIRVAATGWNQCDVTGVAMKMSGFGWMKFRVTTTDYPIRISEGSYQIIKPTTIGTNKIPVAEAGSDQVVYTGDPVTFSGSLSYDPDGSITSYSWDFGDGTYGVGRDVSHVYTTAGAYLVGLKITDNLGASAEDFAFVNVKSPSLPPNIAPVANAGPDLTVTAGQSLILSGAGSIDPDGQVSRWEWDFGDGTSASGETVTKVYGMAGTYLATLTVVDTRGGVGTDTATITVTPPAPTNKVPAANAGPDAYAQLGDTVTFSGAASTDTDGTITSYTWDFGDGTKGSGVAPTKTYPTAGIYIVTLTVTDNAGAMATDTLTMTIHDVVTQNQPPVATVTTDSAGTVAAFSIDQPDTTTHDVAAFAATQGNGSPVTAMKGQVITFSAAGSTDIDGTIASYKWNFSDGTTATGVTVKKTFTCAGNYTVMLTVTDNAGSTGTCLIPATITASGNLPPVANAGPDIIATVERDVTFSAAASKDNDGRISSYTWRFSDGHTAYGVEATHHFSSSGTYTATLTVKDDAGATATDTATITVVRNQAPKANAGPDVAATVGQAITFSGTGSSDPDGYISSYSWSFGDGTSKTGSSVTKSFAAAGTYTVTLTVTDNSGTKATDTAVVTVTATANRPPVANAGADLTATPGQAITFSGAGSSDPDGTIVSYAWTFGDGTTGSGVSAPKSYTTDGTYTVTLTVTDNAGAKTSDTATVTITAAPAYVYANVAQQLSNLSSRTSNDPSSPTDITTKMKDTILTDLYRVDSKTALSFKVVNDAGTTTQIFLRLYVSSISSSQTLRIYPYKSDGRSLNTSYYVDKTVSAKGWLEIDVTSIAKRMSGFGWMKFRVTDAGSVSVAEGNFTIK